MNLHLKGIHQMLQSLVIKFLLLLFVFSCSTSKTLNNSEVLIIINKELERNLTITNNENLHVDLSLNNYLKDFFIRNKIETKDNTIISNLNELSELEFIAIFNLTQVEKIINSINKSDIRLKKFRFQKRVIVDNKKTLSYIEEYKINRLNLSTPVFKKNNGYSLIAFASGKKGSMKGGINVYKKELGNWIYKASIDLWIE